MKTTCILLLWILSTAFLAQAQRLDDVNFNYTYLQLPSHPLQGDFRTYSVMFKPNGINFARLGMLESSLRETYFTFVQYQQVADGGDFVILVTFDGNTLVSKTLKKSEVTEGQGPNARKVTYHSYEVKTRLPIIYALYDGERRLMEEAIFSPYDRIVANTFGKETTVEALDKAWNNTGQTSLDNWLKADFTEQLKALSAHLKSRYDTYAVTRRIPFYTIRNAEKIGYQELADAVMTLRPTVEATTAHRKLQLEDFSAHLNPWQKALAEVDPKDKRLDIVFQMAAYNLAMAHALSGQYDAAIRFANRIAEAGRKDNMTKPIFDFVTDRQTRERANANVPVVFSGRFSAEAHRRFVLEHRQSTPQATTNIGITSAPDFIVLKYSNDTLYGAINPDFAYIGNAQSLQGAWIESTQYGQVKKNYVKAEEILLWRKDGLLQLPLTLPVVVDINTLQTPLYQRSGLNLVRVSEGASTGSLYLVRMARRRGENPLEVYALNEGVASQNLNNMLAQKFDYCPTIVQKARRGYYQRTEASLRELIDDYSICVR